MFNGLRRCSVWCLALRSVPPLRDSRNKNGQGRCERRPGGPENRAPFYNSPAGAALESGTCGAMGVSPCPNWCTDHCPSASSTQVRIRHRLMASFALLHHTTPRKGALRFKMEQGIWSHGSAVNAPPRPRWSQKVVVVVSDDRG